MEEFNFKRQKCCSFFEDNCDNMSISELVDAHNEMIVDDDKFEYHKTLLACAIEIPRLDKLGQLLDFGLDPNQPYWCSSQNVLELAIVVLEDIEATQLLLDRGIDLICKNDSESDKIDVLRHTASSGNTNLFRVLIESDQFKQVVNKNIWLNLEMVKELIQKKDFVMAKMIIEAGLLDKYSLNIDLFNKTLPYVNESEEAFDFCHYLIQKIPNISEICRRPDGGEIYYGPPVFMVAEYCSNEEQKQSLFSALFKKGSETECNYTPFHRSKNYIQNTLFDAIRTKNREIVAVTIAAGANLGLNIDHFYGLFIPYPLSPLADAVRKGDIDIIKMLIDAGADPNLTDEDEMPMLSFVRQNENAQQITELLIAAGSKIIDSDIEGTGVLHHHASQITSSELHEFALRMHERNLEIMNQQKRFQ